MHPSAMTNGRRFRQAYFPNRAALRVAEIGSQNVNGSLRQVFPDAAEYVGIDFCAANGVDVVLDDPYVLPFADGSFDIVLSSSVFEHSEFFWLLFCEAMRVLKPGGLFYLNAPSNGAFHRYPVDSWRFFPDAGNALARWATRCGLPTVLLESYVSEQENDVWNDFVAIFRKSRELPVNPPSILESLPSDAYRNGLRCAQEGWLREKGMTQDIDMLRSAQKRIDDLEGLVAELQARLAGLIGASANG